MSRTLRRGTTRRVVEPRLRRPTGIAASLAGALYYFKSMLVLSLLAKAEASPWTEAGARKRFPSKGTLLYITNAYFYFRYLTFVKKKTGTPVPSAIGPLRCRSRVSLKQNGMASQASSRQYGQERGVANRRRSLGQE